MDLAKNERGTAKRVFTRTANRLQQMIDKREDIGVIEAIFKELEKAHNNATEKHEAYICFLSETEPTSVDEEDKWIYDIDERFDQMCILRQKQCVTNDKDKDIASAHDIEEVGNQENLRLFEEANFTKEVADMMEMMKKSDEIATSVLTEKMNDLKILFEKCKQMAFAKKGSGSNEIKRIEELQVSLMEAKTEYGKVLKEKEDAKEKVIENNKAGYVKERGCNMGFQLGKIEGLKLPKFEGDIREYIRFKTDFENLVNPSSKPKTMVAYALKNCLGKIPEEIIRNVDDDIDKMWERLDEKYGSVTKLTDVVLYDIKSADSVNEGEDNKFLDLVNRVEKGYRDLGRVKMEKEISNTTILSFIEEKLPRDIKREWSKIVNKKVRIEESDEPVSAVNASDRFPAFLDFLMEQKRIIEYENESIRSLAAAANNQYGVTNHLSSGGGNGSDDINNKSNSLYANFGGRNATNNTTSDNIYSNSNNYSNNNGNNNNFNNNYNHNAMNSNSRSKCWFHKSNGHETSECRNYLAKSPIEKAQLIKDNRACWSCLKTGHKSSECTSKTQCPVPQCNRMHHESLHESCVAGHLFHVAMKNPCVLLIMEIKTAHSLTINVLFDSGATLSLMTFRAAQRLNLRGKKVKLDVIKVGNQIETLESFEYRVMLTDTNFSSHYFTVYGIEEISTDIKKINLHGVKSLFPEEDLRMIKRPEQGKIDLLIGLDYASFHPVKQRESGNLILANNRFGTCIGGSHPILQESTKKLIVNAEIHHIQRTTPTLTDFMDVESLGVRCDPKCGGCKCGHCAIGGKQYTIEDERKLHTLETGLTLTETGWTAVYPWGRSPNELPNNRQQAMAMLLSLEKRLGKDPKLDKVYPELIKDMITRKVAKKLTEEEVKNHEGPSYYLSHHEVYKPDSESTPYRLVFNASQKFLGSCLNDYWLKPPDLLNNLLGVLIRFREGKIAVMGDIRKCYHAVALSPLDQHVHRFLWRKSPSERPSTYVMTAVSFGDKPAGAIVITAMRKTADLKEKEYPRAARAIKGNTYVDDVLDSVDTEEEYEDLTKDIDSVLAAGKFEIKEWRRSPHRSKAGHEETHKGKEKVLGERVDTSGDTVKYKMKVLGMHVDTSDDTFKFKVRLNFSPKKRNVRTERDLERCEIPYSIPLGLHKALILGQVNGFYDPPGLAIPVTCKAKMMMRKLWIGEVKKLGWEEMIPKCLREEWVRYFAELMEMEDISFPRCVKPDDAEGNPWLILFSDGSQTAFGACAYVRWKHSDGSYSSCLIAAKGRVAPIKPMTIVRKELCGALLAARLRDFIVKESRFEFRKIYHFVDSEIVLAMIQKESYGFNTYASLRVGEIQELTNVDEEWYWISGDANPADMITRGKHPNEIGQGSRWQVGEAFMKLPEDQWPNTQKVNVENIPEQIKAILVAVVEKIETLAGRIRIDKYSSFVKLIRVTARIQKMYSRVETPSFSNALNMLSSSDLEAAEMFWVADAQSSLINEFHSGKFDRLSPKLREDGIIVVGMRAERCLHMSFENHDIMLLPHNHRISFLYCYFVHNISHSGVASTVSKVRRKFWIIRLQKIAKSIRHKCVQCIKNAKIIREQIMGNLPIERLKPSPPWFYVSLDVFGPYIIKDEVNKRSRGKAFAVIFNCMLTRAVHVDVSADYSTDKFLQVLRRFAALRGYPAAVYSDNGSQLKAADKQMRSAIANSDWKKVAEFGATAGLQWHFNSADAPWQNGCSEALIKSVKKALKHAIGDQVLSFSELQTVLMESANLVNERPIGQHPGSPDDGSYLCPNDILMGRSSSRIPAGPFAEPTDHKKRYEFVQQVVDSFWRKWTRDYFPSLLIRQKWHTERRNMKVDDVVIIKDSNAIRGRWKLGKVCEVSPGTDGKVRNVKVQYKVQSEEEGNNKYTTIERSVNRLIVVVPSDEE